MRVYREIVRLRLANLFGRKKKPNWLGGAVRFDEVTFVITFPFAIIVA